MYMQKNWPLEQITNSATHEITHGLGHYRNEGHSPFMNDLFGVNWNLTKGNPTEIDILLMKLLTYPRPNTDLTNLRKETRYDKN